MASRSNRWAVNQAVVELLAAHEEFDGVEVTAAPPGDKKPRSETVWCQRITGDRSIPVSTGGRMHRDDQFSMVYRVAVLKKATSTTDEAAERVEEIFAAFDDIVSDDPSLDDMDGVISVEVSTYDGPSTEPTPNGPVAWAEVTVAVHSRLT